MPNQMTVGRWERIKSVFDSTLELPPEDRAAFLANACMGDQELREQVSRLLLEFEKTETFLGQPVARLSHSLPPGEFIAGRYRVFNFSAGVAWAKSTRSRMNC